jgi:ubiquinone/menaquinone biosynthesis C-methylase UbiE
VSDQAIAAHHDAAYQFDDLIAAEEWHFWFRIRRDLVLWALDRYLGQTRALLEVGCGAGFVLSGLREQMPSIRLSACDRSTDALTHASRRAKPVHLFQADVTSLPATSAFDAVLALDVIEHVDDDQAALAEIFRVLRPGGGVVLTVPQHPWLWSQVDEFSCHRRRYQRRELLDKVRRAGFEVLHATSCFMTTLPLAMIARRRRGDTFDPAAELKISKAANAIMKASLVPELWLTRLGVSLPAGSSLMVVAQRARP